VDKVLLLNPDLICPSVLKNRSESEYGTPEFKKLKELIAASGGNVQPIQARSPGRSRPSRVSACGIRNRFGHRRHRACLELNVPVLTYTRPRLDVDSAEIEFDLFIDGCLS
jgi:ParB family chromosome partitioning protein